MFYFKGNSTNKVVISNLTLIKEGSPGKEAITIDGCNLYTNDIEIKNYCVGYNVSKSDEVKISNNFFSLPRSPLLKHVRAGVFNQCKSIAIINSTVVFESILDFEQIKKHRLVTYQLPYNN